MGHKTIVVLKDGTRLEGFWNSKFYTDSVKEFIFFYLPGKGLKKIDAENMKHF